MLDKGSLVRNLNDPDDGICIVLDVGEDRIEVYSDEKESAISLRRTLARLEPVDSTECPPAFRERLQDALRQFEADQEEILLGKLAHYVPPDSDDEDYDAAIENYTEALKANPDASSVRFARGGAYRRMRQWARAEADFLALRDDPDYRRQALVLAAFCRLSQARPHGAIELLEVALGADPARRDALEKAAEAHERAAEQHRERALEYRRRLEDIQAGLNQMKLFQCEGARESLSALPPLD